MNLPRETTLKSATMPTPYPLYAIPKEIVCIERTNYGGSHKRTSKKQHRHSMGSASAQSFRYTSSAQYRRQESLQSVSSEACSEAKKFMEARRKDVMFEYSTPENCGFPSKPTEHKHELSLSELAGLLSTKLDDAMGRGLISFGDSSTLDESKNTNEQQTEGNDALHL